MSISEFKIRAKQVLSSTYWMSFLAVIIFILIQNVVSGIGSSVRMIITGSTFDYSKYFQYIADGNSERAQKYLYEVYYGGNIVASVISLLITVAVSVFVINVIQVGMNKMFINSRRTLKVDIGDMFTPFKAFMPTVKTMFFYGLYIFLWSLLLWVPGIIKSFSYFMVPYIIAENPGISTGRAFEISKKAMDGEKGNCFILNLSFIGWYLLGLIACCLGMYFVIPYQRASLAEFYTYVKQKALATGIATPEDFGIKAAVQ